MSLPGTLLGSGRQKFSHSERKRDREKDMPVWFFWTLSVLDVTPGTNAVILPENETNKWQRAEPRESHRKKSSTLKNYYTWNSIPPILLVKLGNLSRDFC